MSSNLPPEICIELLSQIYPDEETSTRDCKRVFSNLALVSRFFYSISTPRLFESLDIDLSLSRPPFLQALGSDDAKAKDLAQFVKTVSLRKGPGWWDNLAHMNLEEGVSGPCSAYLRAMQKMPNLENLRMTRLYISSAVVNWYTTLPAMKSLSLDDCFIPSFFPPNVWQTFAQVGQRVLTSFTSHYVQNSVSIQEISWISPPLTILRIEFMPPEASLVDILEALPTLIELLLGDIRLPDPEMLDSPCTEPIFTFSPTCLPNLRRLRCPLAALSSFIPHHFARLISLDISEGYIEQGLKRFKPRIQLASGLLEELVISPRYFPFLISSQGSLTRSFPQLKALVISGYVHIVKEEEYALLLERVAFSCSSEGKIRELRFYVTQPSPGLGSVAFRYDLPWQRKMISLLTSRENELSGLMNIAFDRNFTWVREPGCFVTNPNGVRHEEADWRPFIPSSIKSSKDFVQGLLRSITLPLVFMDYKGWIGRELGWVSKRA